MAFLLDPPTTAPTEPPNVLRLLLHPDPLRPWIEDWETAAQVLIARAQREGPNGAPDERTATLIAEVLAYPGVPGHTVASIDEDPPPVLALSFVKNGVRSSWFTTITTFGTAQDITLQDLRIKGFFPADDETESLAGALAD